MIAETYVVTTAAGPDGLGFVDGFGFGCFEGLGLGDGLCEGTAVGLDVVCGGPSESDGSDVGAELGLPVEPLGRVGSLVVRVGELLPASSSTPLPPLVDVHALARAATATQSETTDFLITDQNRSHGHTGRWHDIAMSVRGFAPESVLAQINERTGIGLELVSIATMATSYGAAYVRWPDGRDAVLTCAPTAAAHMQVTADILNRARSAGLPVPQYELVVGLGESWTAVVQERLPGTTIWRVDPDLIDALVAVNDRFAGFLDDRPDMPNRSLGLRREPENEWRHEPLERYDGLTRRILRRIQEIGDEVPDRLRGNDLVHNDFARGNVLTDDHGRITGVIDWNEGVARGDRNWALVSLRSDLEWDALPRNGIDEVHQAAMDRLDRVLADRLDPTTLRAYWAFWTLIKLDGLIWSDRPDAIEVFLDLGFRRLY